MNPPAVAVFFETEAAEAVAGFEAGKAGCLAFFDATEECSKCEIEPLQCQLEGVRMHRSPSGSSLALLGERPALRREREGFFRGLVVGDPLLQAPVVNLPAGVRCPRQLQPRDGSRVDAVFDFALAVHPKN